MEPLSNRLCEPDTPTLFENSAAVVYLASELHMNPGVWGHNVQLTRNPGTNCLIVTPHWPFDLCLVVRIIEYALSMHGIVFVEVWEIILLDVTEPTSKARDNYRQARMTVKYIYGLQNCNTVKSRPGGRPKGPKPPKPQPRKQPPPPPSTATSHIQTPKLQQPPLPTTSPCGTLPLNWPSNLPYLTAPLFSPLLTPSHYSALRTRPPANSIEPLDELPADYVAGPCKKAVILPITDKRHPACGQAGLFAARDLKPGELVVRYLGEIHPGGEEWGGRLVFPPSEEGEEEKEEGDEDGKTDKVKQLAKEEKEEEQVKYNYKQSDYDLWLDHALDLAIDAARCGNEARFVNDYRGVPNPAFPLGYKPQSKKEELFMKRPNAEFKVVWDPQRQERAMAVYVLPAGKKAVGRAREVGVARGEEVVARDRSVSDPKAGFASLVPIGARCGAAFYGNGDRTKGTTEVQAGGLGWSETIQHPSVVQTARSRGRYDDPENLSEQLSDHGCLSSPLRPTAVYGKTDRDQARCPQRIGKVQG
ncbi:hypothetical protein B0T13DRAFT_445250 [Neurospora crassa]|nr:hypothetical protein B0T13DRAFT_445250 [Neurospora crassa]